MQIISLTQAHLDEAAPLVAAFRVALKSYKGISAAPDFSAGRDEMAEYLDAGFPVYAAMQDGELAGYAVCRVDAPCVWLESLYVRPGFRRQGIASALVRKAEALARSYGEETLYHYVHPNNHGTYYDLQVLGAAVFTGREWLAKKICQTAYQRRIAAHVEPSGAQPLELARTRAMSYSQYNLIAMIHIANIADHLGFGAYWQKDPVQGVCFIRAAADYLYPYIVNPETFPYQQIVANTGEQTGAQIYALLDAHFPGEGYAEKSARWQTADMLWRAVPAR